MSLTLEMHTSPDVPLEAHVLRPDHLASLSLADIEKQKLHHGNSVQALADFFKVSGSPSDELHLQGDFSLVKHIGHGMQGGSLNITGNVGAHLGAEMAGGSITVNGDVGDWLAPEMIGGSVTVTGNAGHMVGSAYRGSPHGITGGEIIIHGSARNEVGHGMRNGLIAIGGGCGDFTGVNMLAGSIFVLGNAGIRAGAGMVRGSIVFMNEVDMLPTFSYSCIYQPTFLRVYLSYLQQCGLPVSDEHILGSYRRWCGDRIELNRGEILLYDK